MTATPIDGARKKPVNIDLEFQTKLDRFGLLELKYQQERHWLDEREELKTLIRKRYESADAESRHRAEGKHYYVDLGPKELKRSVTHPRLAFAALKKAIGLEKLIEALSYTFKLLDAHVSAEDQKKFAKQERTGSRDVTAVPIAAAAA